jgi:hypothetical protein
MLMMNLMQVQFKEGTFQPPAISSSVDLPEQVDIFGQNISLGPVQQALNSCSKPSVALKGPFLGSHPSR